MPIHISCDLGWYYKTKADYIYYVVNDEILYKIDWLKFKDWFIGELRKGRWFPVKISSEGYGYTLNIAITWWKISENLYKIFKF